MNLRDATRDDLDEICALIGELAEYEGMSQEVVLEPAVVGDHLFGAAPAARVLLITDGARIAGFALWFPTYSTFLGQPGIWLEDLFVRAEHRGRGYGRAVLDQLRSMTDGRIEWNVLDWNESAIRFYDRLGAAPVRGWTTYRWTTDHRRCRRGPGHSGC